MEKQKEIRVVAAVVHQGTNEVEIIVKRSFFSDTENTKEFLTSMWIDCEQELTRIEKEKKKEGN